jgi:hypothetical protein
MSLTGNFDKFSQPKADTKPASNGDEKENEQYPTPGQNRNLCFVQADGKRLFLNYAYLIAGEYEPESNTITLNFSTHTVTLKGRNLENLYESIMLQLQREIVGVESRYVEINDKESSFVTEIFIDKGQ